jgi:hypothetical protein
MVATAVPVFTVFNQGQVVPGAKVYTYITATNTLLTTYADAALTTPNANPIIADANGQVTFFVPTANNLKLGLYTADNAFIRNIDPVYPAAIATGGSSGSEATIASAATTDIGSAGVNIIKVTGTTGITSFGSSGNLSNPIYYIRFTGVLTITNGANIICPGGSNITTANGSAIIAQYIGAGVWQILFVQSASGGSFLQVSNNLSDVANAATAINNLIGAGSQGDVLIRGASGWSRLAPGTSGNFLRTNGAGADPSWAAGGGVTSVATSGGITGGTITTSGTVSLDTNNTLGVGSTAWFQNTSGGTINSAATVAGSGILTCKGTSTGFSSSGGSNPSGTWRNTSGFNVPNNDYGQFTRTA